LKPAAPAIATFRPAVGLPVNDNPSMSGCAASAAPVVPSPVTTPTSPGGSPASSASARSRSAESGVYSDGLITTALPQPMPAAARSMKPAVGPFQGRITPTTPSGSRTVYERWPGNTGSSSPSSPAIADQYRNRPAAAGTSRRESRIGLPIARVSSSDSSAVAPSTSAAHRRIASARRETESALHTRCAARAAATAASTSAVPSSGTAATASAVAGLITS
jgi:hypothetical protein